MQSAAPGPTRLNITLTIQGRFLTASSSSVQPGIDVSVSKTDDNRLVIPFSLVKGKLREALNDSAKGSEWASKWLMDKGHTDSTIQRGRLRFSDFVSEPIAGRIETDTRTAVDPISRCVKEGMLLTFESPITAGMTKEFSGSIEFLSNEIDIGCVEPV